MWKHGSKRPDSALYAPPGHINNAGNSLTSPRVPLWGQNNNLPIVAHNQTAAKQMELSCSYWLIPLANVGVRGRKHSGVVVGHWAALGLTGISFLCSADCYSLIHLSCLVGFHRFVFNIPGVFYPPAAIKLATSSLSKTISHKNWFTKRLIQWRRRVDLLHRDIATVAPDDSSALQRNAALNTNKCDAWDGGQRRHFAHRPQRVHTWATAVQHKQRSSWGIIKRDLRGNSVP